MSVDSVDRGFALGPEWRAGVAQREIISKDRSLRDLLARAAVAFFARTNNGRLVGSQFRLANDGEDEVLLGVHKFASGNEVVTEHTVSPRYAEGYGDEDEVDRCDTSLVDARVDDLEEYYVLESENPDHGDFSVVYTDDVAAFERLLRSDRQDADQAVSN